LFFRLLAVGPRDHGPRKGARPTGPSGRVPALDTALGNPIGRKGGKGVAVSYSRRCPETRERAVVGTPAWSATSRIVTPRRLPADENGNVLRKRLQGAEPFVKIGRPRGGRRSSRVAARGGRFDGSTAGGSWGPGFEQTWPPGRCWGCVRENCWSHRCMPAPHPDCQQHLRTAPPAAHELIDPDRSGVPGHDVRGYTASTG
jgi:hypothetical protein